MFLAAVLAQSPKVGHPGAKRQSAKAPKRQSAMPPKLMKPLRPEELDVLARKGPSAHTGPFGPHQVDLSCQGDKLSLGAAQG